MVMNHKMESYGTSVMGKRITSICFSAEKSALQIDFYSEDFQVVNPLGSKVLKYKLRTFYFTLGNISPKYRSKLEMIQLLILCKNCVMKKYGFIHVVQRLVDDLHSLETDGLEFEINDGTVKAFHGTIAFILTDNLAAHTLSGLMESFSTLRSCRFCLTTRDGRQDMFSNSVCFEKKKCHRDHVERVRQYPQVASTYGVKVDTPFNTLTYFHSGVVIQTWHKQ